MDSKYVIVLALILGSASTVIILKNIVINPNFCFSVWSRFFYHGYFLVGLLSEQRPSCGNSGR